MKAETKRREDEKRAEENHLLFSANDVEESPFSDHLAKLHPKEETDGNMYHLPDGRIVDAGLSIYKPEVIFENPAEAYDDRPGEDH